MYVCVCVCVCMYVCMYVCVCMHACMYVCMYVCTIMYVCLPLRYVITCLDYYTKWAEAGALRNKSAIEAAQFLYSLFCRHGLPVHVMSDQGREFDNNLNKELFTAMGVNHIVSSAYHPQTNGLVERFNQTLQRSLLKMVGDNESDWFKYLGSVLFAYNTSRQASTKYSPFFLLYGRHPRLPVDLQVDQEG